MLISFLFLSPGFLTLPTAYVTGNPVECVLHPNIWNTTSFLDPLGVGHILKDEYEEDNVGYQIGTVRHVEEEVLSLQASPKKYSFVLEVLQPLFAGQEGKKIEFVA